MMENGKNMSEIKVGTKLIAVDENSMYDTKKKSLIVGKEYEVIKVYEDDCCFDINSELFLKHTFDFEDAEGTVFKIKEERSTKPSQYQIGIDTFERMRANATYEEAMGFIRWNIDKYNTRQKGQDEDDYKKIISYAQEALWWIRNK